MSTNSKEMKIEMYQLRLIWSPYAELTEDNLMNTDLQDTLNQLFWPNEQNLTDTLNHTKQVQEKVILKI